MSNVFSGFGKVIGIKYKEAGEVAESSLLDLTLNIQTGERKKEGEDYAPSFLVSVALWGARADGLKEKVFTGQRMYVSGSLSGVNAYVDNEGTAKGTIKLGGRNVEVKPIDWPDSEGEGQAPTKEAAPKATTEKKSTAKKTTKQTEPDFSDLDALLEE